MTRALTILGVVMMIAGLVWLLQGVNILPGSFMTGQTFWAWSGIVTFVLGGVLAGVSLARK